MIAKGIKILFVVAALMALILACGSSNQATYTRPPGREAPLTDADSGSGKSKFQLPPKILKVEYEVPGPDSCPVKIALYGTGRKAIRDLADSIYAPGKYTIQWIAKGNDSVFLDFGTYYYKFDICGKVHTQTLRYRPTYK